MITKGVSGAAILGMGRSLSPDLGRFVENEEIHSLLYGDDWPAKMRGKGLDPDHPHTAHGFQTRFWTHTPGDKISRNETTSADLMEAAAKEALHNSHCEAGDIDLFITATTTSPFYTSSTAAVVGGRLGLRCAAFEMKSGCASSVFALAAAYRFIDGGADRVLIACGETLTKVTPRKSPLVYAASDGGAAVVIGRVDNNSRGLTASVLNTDGSLSSLIGVPGYLPPVLEDMDSGAYELKQSGEIEDFTRAKWTDAPKQLLEISSLRPDQIDAYIPHQVNRPMIEYSAVESGFTREKLVDRVSKYGNCGCISILLAMQDALNSGKIRPESRVMLNAVGGGISWGGLLITV